MGFLSFSIKNIFRGKLRFILTLSLLVVGISALSSSIGLFYFSEDLLHMAGNDNGGANFNIYSNNIQFNNTFSLEELNKIQSIHGVKEAVGSSVYVVSEYNTDTNDDFYLAGFSGTNISNDCRVPGIGHIKLIKGRLPIKGTHEILIDINQVKAKNLQVGDNITLTGIETLNGLNQITEKNGGGVSSDQNKYFKTIQENFTVVGIINELFSGGKDQEFYVPTPDGIIDLDMANNLMYNSNTPKFDFIYLKADPNQINQIKTDIKKLDPNYIIWDDDKYINNINTLFMYLLSLFLTIGTLIVTITMLRSLNERRKEIGVLKAIGWSDKRVMGMIFIETITQTIIAWAIALTLILIFIAIKSKIGLLNYFESNISSVTYFLIITLSLSLAMAIIGSLILQIYMTRLKPTESLKYE